MSSNGIELLSLKVNIDTLQRNDDAARIPQKGESSSSNPQKNEDTSPNPPIIVQHKRGTLRRSAPWASFTDDVQVGASGCALVAFLVTFNMKSLSKLPYPVTGHLMDRNSSQVWQNISSLLIFIYCFKSCRTHT